MTCNRICMLRSFRRSVAIHVSQTTHIPAVYATGYSLLLKGMDRLQEIRIILCCGDFIVSPDVINATFPMSV